jgi:hypothetical protein
MTPQLRVQATAAASLWKTVIIFVITLYANIYLMNIAIHEFMRLLYHKNDNVYMALCMYLSS